MRLFDYNVYSIDDLRDVIEDLLSINNVNIITILDEFRKNRQAFVRHFGSSVVSLLSHQQFSAYKKICDVLDNTNDKELLNAISEFIDLKCLKEILIDKPLIYNLSEGISDVPGPKPFCVKKAPLRVCRIEGESRKIKILCNGEILGKVKTMNSKNYVYAVEIKDSFNSFQFTELLDYKSSSEKFDLELREKNSSHFGSVLCYIDRNGYEIPPEDYIVSIAVYKDAYLVVNNKGELKYRGNLDKKVFYALTQLGERMVYIKSYKNCLVSLSTDGILRYYASDTSQGVINDVYWSDFDEDGQNIYLKYRSFNEEFEKINTIKLC